MEGEDQRRQWSARELRHLVRNEMDTALSVQLGFLSRSMSELVGTQGDPDVPKPLQRKGLIAELKDESAQKLEMLTDLTERVKHIEQDAHPLKRFWDTAIRLLNLAGKEWKIVTAGLAAFGLGTSIPNCIALAKHLIKKLLGSR